MTPVLVTPPAAQILTLVQVKDHLRVSHDDENVMIQNLIDAAHSFMDGLDGPLGRCLTVQTWQIRLHDAGTYCFVYPDVVSVIGAEWTAGARIIAIADAGVVQFVCEMPEALLPTARQAMLLLIGSWYENRQAAGEAKHAIPMAFEMLVDRLRRMTV